MNFFACIIIGSAVFAFGSLWYSPILFGSYWRKQNDIDKNMIELSSSWKNQLAGLFNGIVMATGFDFLFYKFAITSMFDALLLAFVIWIAFMTPMLFSRVLWEQRSVGLHLLDKIYYFNVIIFIAVLTFVFR